MQIGYGQLELAVVVDPSVQFIPPKLQSAKTNCKGETQPEATPFKLKALNSTSPLENWNLTVLLKVTAPTVMLLAPSV